jgi:outer membrane protein TolC
MRRAPIVLALLLASFPLVGQAAGITLWDVPSLVTAKDLSIDMSAQSARMAYNQYRSTLAQGLPQINLTPSYGVQYAAGPTQGYTTYNNNLTQQTTSDQASQNVGASLSVSQLLPTAGSLSLSLGHTLTADSSSSVQTYQFPPGVNVTTYPSAQFSQAPKLSLSLTQPLFLNGKLMDFDLFPATFRQAQLGYLVADQQKRAQVNQTLQQSFQFYLQVVQLRKNIAQMENAIAVGQGNLVTLMKNYSLGSVAEADLLDSRISLANQRGGLLDLRAALGKVERALGHSFGLGTLEGVALSQDIPTVDFAMKRDDAVAKAMANHPLIRKASLDAEGKKVADVLAGQAYASSLSLSFSYWPRYGSGSILSSPTYDFNDSFTNLYSNGAGSNFSLSANLTLHLFDGGKQQADRAANAAAIKLAQDSVLTQQQSVQDSVDIDLMQKANLEEKISVLVDAVDLARMRAQTEASLLGLGKSTDLQVRAKQADYEAKQNDLWRTRADLFLTVIDLNALAGEDLAHIIQGKAQ